VVDHVGVFSVDRLLVGMRVGVCHLGHHSLFVMSRHAMSRHSLIGCRLITFAQLLVVLVELLAGFAARVVGDRQVVALAVWVSWIRHSLSVLSCASRLERRMLRT